MSNVDFRGAEKKIDKVLMGFFTDDPVLLNVYCMVERQPTPRQETIGINTKTRVPCIEYNPNWVNTVSQEQLELVMVSEGFKVLLKHVTTRLRDPRQISALSSSITVNQLMNSDIASILGDLNSLTPTAEKFNLPPKEFFEEYYRKLMERVDETNEKIKQIWNSMSDQQKQDMIDKAQQGQGEPQEGQGEPQDGEGQGEGQGDGYKDYDDKKEAMKDYFDPNGTSNDGWGTNDLFDADVQNFVDSKRDSARDWGKHTGNAMADIIAAHTPKISWKEIVRRFARSVLSGETISSRMKVNRRYGLRSPGYRRQYKSKVIFAIDISGSMSNDDIAEGFAVVNSCLKHADIDYVTFDTEIKDVCKNMKKAKDMFKISGRGGTDVAEVLQYAKDNKADGLVIFSDMCFCTPEQPPARVKVLWLSHSAGQEPPVDWGFKAHLERFEDA